MVLSVKTSGVIPYRGRSYPTVICCCHILNYFTRIKVQCIFTEHGNVLNCAAEHATSHGARHMPLRTPCATEHATCHGAHHVKQSTPHATTQAICRGARHMPRHTPRRRPCAAAHATCHGARDVPQTQNTPHDTAQAVCRGQFYFNCKSASQKLGKCLGT